MTRSGTMLTVWIDDSQKQDDLVLARELENAAKPANLHTTISNETKVCREIWNQLKPVLVRIPFATRIRFTNSKNRRNSTMLLDLIRSSALMNQYQRERVDIGGMVEILADKKDFEMAQEIYHQLNGICGAQATKLTRSEQMLVDAIRATGRTEFTVKQMQKLITRSQSTISRILTGKPDRDDHDGLLDKCPAISYHDSSMPREGGGFNREQVFTWDYEMDELWSAGISCWLDESDDDTNTDPDDNLDGAMHRYAHVMHPLCTTECIDTEPTGGPVPDNTDELPESSSAMHTPVCACTKSPDESDPLCANGNNAYIISKSVINSDIKERKDKLPCTAMHNECITVHSMHRSGTDLSKERPWITNINPAMFYSIDKDPGKVCDCCGRKGVAYREKGGGRSRPGQDRHQICEQCYSKAVSREILSFRALPGVLPIRSMKKTDRNLGRCHLCNLHPVTWYDEETKIGLCERCYYREKFSGRNDAGGVV